METERGFYDYSIKERKEDLGIENIEEKEDKNDNIECISFIIGMIAFIVCLVYLSFYAAKEVPYKECIWLFFVSIGIFAVSAICGSLTGGITYSILDIKGVRKRVSTKLEKYQTKRKYIWKKMI